MVTCPIIEPSPLKAGVLEIFERLRDRPYPFLLDSSLPVNGLGRYCIIGADPFLVLTARGTRVRLEGEQGTEVVTGHPLAILGDLLRKYRQASPPDPVPFAGGLAGYFSYDLGRTLEHLPSLAEDDLHTPDLGLAFYDRAVVVDMDQGQTWLVSAGFPETGPGAARRAQTRLAELETLLKNRPPDRGCTGVGFTGNAHPVARSPFDRESYARAVQKVREYIAAGDIFQANISQRFSVPRTADPWHIYRRLREISPAPMGAFLDHGAIQIASSSMERFLKVTGRLVETRPIKGTRPRGRDAQEDALLRQELWHSAKDRAELVMIVDMERNDLGRVCRPGSVRVPELYRLEEYATVFHLVSTVTGELAAGKDVTDLLRASFPGGSITGAPKIRAMEIIEELEPVRRGIYTGSIGYIAFNGNADLNIVIRTMIFQDGQVYFQTGGGITIDSDPYQEYQETLDKARAMMEALAPEGTGRR